MFLEDVPSLPSCVLSTLADLIFNGKRRLAVTAKASVEGAAKVHRVSLADGRLFR
jgi:hypothetical protein